MVLPTALFYQTREGDPKGRKRSLAFSLTELLVTVFLIAVLAILLFPAMSALRSRSDQISCTSNLKTIWSAVLLYVQDHGGMLPYSPAAFLDSRYTAKNVEKPATLVHRLAPYLADDARVAATSQHLGPFVCRAALRVMADDQLATKRICYQQSPTVLPDGTTILNPFGLESGGVPVAPAVRLNTLQRPNLTIAIFDRGSTSATYQKVPTPAHGNYRNFLFFDGHVSVIYHSQFGPANGQIRY